MKKINLAIIKSFLKAMSDYLIIKATLKDLQSIMNIVKDAKTLLKKNGLKQWNTNDNYPTEETFINDINKGFCFVCKKADLVIGVCSIIDEIDKDYINIYQGKWLTNSNNYLSIHRLAVKNEYYGLNVSTSLVNYAVILARKLNKSSVRIDTHPLNIPAQKLFTKCGFEKTGVIYLSRSNEDNKRIAFEYCVKGERNEINY